MHLSCKTWNMKKINTTQRILFKKNGEGEIREVIMFQLWFLSIYSIRQINNENFTCVVVLCKGCCCIMCGVLMWPVFIPLWVWLVWTTWPCMFIGVSCWTFEEFPEASCTEPKFSPEADCCKNILKKKKIRKLAFKKNLLIVQDVL